MKYISMMIAAGVAVTAALNAQAQVADDFEQYASGDVLHHVNNWKGWNDVQSSAGVVSTDRAYDGTKSIRIHGYMDAVWAFSGVNTDTWTMSAKQYIPSGQSGNTYFIMMNRYVDNGNSDGAMWSVQLRFDLSQGKVYDDLRGGSTPIATDQWSDVRVEVDLTQNTVREYYNNTLISSGTWTRGSGSSMAVAALDLYSNQSNTTYYDSVSLAPTAGSISIASLGLGLLATRSRRRPVAG